MFRSRSENLRSIYVLLFLTIAFFFLEYQDAQKYARLFEFDRGAVAAGQVWRLFTYQFTQSGQGWFAFPRPVALFFTLLLLYLMGAAVEEEWGTTRFLTFFTVSTLGAAGAAALLGIPLLGSYFVNFTLLFVYASVYPHQTFYLFAIVPVRIRWIAYLAAAMLIVGVFIGGAANIAAFAGALAGYGYFLSQRVWNAAPLENKDAEPEVADSPDRDAIRNAARFVAIKRAVNSGAAADIDRLVGQLRRDIVEGVNICPPADYKPEHIDGYCIRCEGFTECAVRYLLANRPKATVSGETATVPERIS